MSKFTQQAIIDTFLKMLACKSLDKITVKEIVNECGINRNTFYYYYKDIYDLLEDVVSTESKNVIEKYLMAVTPNFIRRFVTLNSENIEINEKNIIFICDFYKYAVTGCTIEWIRSGMPEEREEFVKKIADIFEATVSDAVKAFEIKKN